MNLIEIFYKKIQKIQGIKIYHEKQLDLTKQTAICSINLEEYDSGSVSDELMERFSDNRQDQVLIVHHWYMNISVR